MKNNYGVESAHIYNIENDNTIDVAVRYRVRFTRVFTAYFSIKYYSSFLMFHISDNFVQFICIKTGHL